LIENRREEGLKGKSLSPICGYLLSDMNKRAGARGKALFGDITLALYWYKCVNLVYI